MKPHTQSWGNGILGRSPGPRLGRGGQTQSTWPVAGAAQELGGVSRLLVGYGFSSESPEVLVQRQTPGAHPRSAESQSQSRNLHF